jgi:hypothetical protein
MGKPNKRGVMRNRTRTETLIEKHETWVVRKGAGKRWLCDQCIEQNAMFTPYEAAMMRCVSQLTIFRLVEGGHLHFKETPDGGLFVCLASLPAEIV